MQPQHERGDDGGGDRSHEWIDSKGGGVLDGVRERIDRKGGNVRDGGGGWRWWKGGDVRDGGGGLAMVDVKGRGWIDSKGGGGVLDGVRA